MAPQAVQPLILESCDIDGQQIHRQFTILGDSHSRHRSPALQLPAQDNMVDSRFWRSLAGGVIGRTPNCNVVGVSRDAIRAKGDDHVGFEATQFLEQSLSHLRTRTCQGAIAKTEPDWWSFDAQCGQCAGTFPLSFPAQSRAFEIPSRNIGTSIT